MRLRALLLAAALGATAVTTACSGQPHDRVLVENGTLPPDLTMPKATTTTAAPPRGAAAIDETSPVTTAGIGPLQFGTNVAEAEKAAGTSFVKVDGSSAGCQRVRLEQGPDGLQLFVSKGSVVGLEVDSGGVSTRSGAGIGDTLHQLSALFGKQLVVEGDTATFVPKDASDAGTSIVFDLKGGNVVRFRAGQNSVVRSGC